MSWFRNSTLHVGLAYWPELQQSPTPVFTFQKDIIEHDLTFQNAETVRIKIKAISQNEDNTKTEIEIGHSDGEERTLHYHNATSRELKEFATRDLERFRFTGFRGTFKSFGVPVVSHGDKVQIIDPVIKDRNGLYIAKAIETTFGLSGYKQVVELRPKV